MNSLPAFARREQNDLASVGHRLWSALPKTPGRLPLVNTTPAFFSTPADTSEQSYACGMQVAVVLCPNLLTTEGSFDSPTVVPQVP